MENYAFLNPKLADIKVSTQNVKFISTTDQQIVHGKYLKAALSSVKNSWFPVCFSLPYFYLGSQDSSCSEPLGLSSTGEPSHLGLVLTLNLKQPAAD